MYKYWHIHHESRDCQTTMVYHATNDMHPWEECHMVLNHNMDQLKM